jgi:hypothetical protein
VDRYKKIKLTKTVILLLSILILAVVVILGEKNVI